MSGVELWLTPREQEVIQLLAADFTVQRIARKLAITANSVRTTLARARERLGVHSQAALVHWAWQHGYIGDRAHLQAENEQLTAELDGRPRLLDEIHRLRDVIEQLTEEKAALSNQVDNLTVMYRTAVMHRPQDQQGAGCPTTAAGDVCPGCLP